MLGPLACLVLGVASILFFILVLRLHAFFALIISALLVAFLSDRVGWDAALFLVIQRFYQMVLSLGALLVLAALIGKCLMDSGAAERIVRTFTRIFGPGRETYSLLSSGFVLSIPVFFDTVFYLLSPLARAVYARQKRDYVLIVCSAAKRDAVPITRATAANVARIFRMMQLLLRVWDRSQSHGQVQDPRCQWL